MTVLCRGKGQCLSDAAEVTWAKPEALPRLHESTDLSQGIERVISHAGQGYVYLIICLGYSVQSLRSNGMCLVHIAGYTTRANTYNAVHKEVQTYINNLLQCLERSQ